MPHSSGIERQPSRSSCSPSRSVISGLISSISPESSVSMTTTRRRTPTCGAASPTPSAFRMVSAMSSSSVSILPSIFSTARHLARSVGSPFLRIFSKAIFAGEKAFEKAFSPGPPFLKLSLTYFYICCNTRLKTFPSGKVFAGSQGAFFKKPPVRGTGQRPDPHTLFGLKSTATDTRRVSFGAKSVRTDANSARVRFVSLHLHTMRIRHLPLTR